MPKPNEAQIKQWVETRLAQIRNTIDEVLAGNQSISAEDLRKAMGESAVLTTLLDYINTQLPDV